VTKGGRIALFAILGAGAGVAAVAAWRRFTAPIVATPFSPTDFTPPPAQALASASAPSGVPSLSVRLTGRTSAVLSWPDVPGATYYVVQHTDANGNPAASPLVLNGLEAVSLIVTGTPVMVGTTYRSGPSIAHVTVQACNPYGCSTPSQPILISFPG
jgi:hypothetical protein